MHWKIFLHDFGVANFGFVTPGLSTMKMSEAIRKGDALGYEETISSYRGCAIGTGYRFKTGKNLHYNLAAALASLRSGSSTKVAIQKLHEEVAGEFHVPVSLVAQADQMHRDGRSRLQVADWLAKQGY